MKNHVLNAMGVLALGFGLAGCEEEKKPEVSPAVSALQAAEPVPSAAEPSEPEKASRPETIPMDLTDERRAKLTKAYPDAQGFTLAADLEGQLRKNKALKDEQKAAKARYHEIELERELKQSKGRAETQARQLREVRKEATLAKDKFRAV